MNVQNILQTYPRRELIRNSGPWRFEISEFELANRSEIAAKMNVTVRE